MPIFANSFPEDFEAGTDFVQIEDEEFVLASEPQGLIAIGTTDDSGYLTLEAAKRLSAALLSAIANSEAAPPDIASIVTVTFDDEKMVLVPRVPGREMLEVGNIAIDDWKAMIAKFSELKSRDLKL